LPLPYHAHGLSYQCPLQFHGNTTWMCCPGNRQKFCMCAFECGYICSFLPTMLRSWSSRVKLKRCASTGYTDTEKTLATDDPPAKKKLIYQGIFPPLNPASVPTPVGSRKIRLALVPHSLGLITSGTHIPRSAPFRTCKRLWMQLICRRCNVPPFHSSVGQSDASHSPGRSMMMTVLAKKKSPR